MEDPFEMVDDKGVELVVHKVTKMADELFLYERRFLSDPSPIFVLPCQ